MEEKKKLASMVKEKLTEVKSYWKKAPDGKYIPFKEIAAYSVGGAGVYFIFSLMGLIALNAGSMLVAAGIGIDVVDLQTMNVISTVIGFLFAPARAMAFDNTRSKMGKFRPYILYMGLPTAICGCAFVYMPYETMDYSQKCITVFVLFTLLQFFSPFYQNAYTSLVQVLSPNSSERTWVIEISAIVYSFAPTVINPVLPLIGKLEDMRTYRISFPIFCVVGLIVSMLAVFGTNERIIVPKSHIQKMGFIEGLKKVSRNKYFWIINSSSWLGFLNTGIGYLFHWIFYYGMNNPTLYALLVVIKGEASTPGMALAAPLTNKFGKKKIFMISMIGQLFCLVMMRAFYKSFIPVFVFMFLKDTFGALSIIFLPSINADMMDYQQYKTGDRLEGFIGQSGPLLTSAISLVTGYAIPFILKGYGLSDNYADLYSSDFRNPIVKAMLICGIIGTVLSIIPMLFYDLDENKRSNMIKVLKIRATFEDYINGEMSEENFAEIAEAIEEAEEIIRNSEKYDKALVEATKITAEEIYKFETEEYISRLKRAEQIVKAGLDSLREFDRSTLVEAQNMPKETKVQKRERREAIRFAKDLERSAKLISHYYPDGITRPDKKALDNAYLMVDVTKEQKKAKKLTIKKTENDLKIYNTAAKPFIEAELMLKRQKAYSEFEELKKQYLNKQA